MASPVIIPFFWKSFQGKNQRYELKAMANVTYDTEAEGVIDGNVEPNTATVRLMCFMLSQIISGILIPFD